MAKRGDWIKSQKSSPKKTKKRLEIKKAMLAAKKTKKRS